MLIDGTAIGESDTSSARFTTISGSDAASFGNSGRIAGNNYHC